MPQRDLFGFLGPKDPSTIANTNEATQKLRVVRRDMSGAGRIERFEGSLRCGANECFRYGSPMEQWAVNNDSGCQSPDAGLTSNYEALVLPFLFGVSSIA
jgi:hypothetical protein